MGSPRRGRLLTGLLAVAILAGCGSNPPGSSGGPSNKPAPHPFSEADVQRAVEDLASLGVETRIRPADAAPISAITGNPSAVRLLRAQVRNLALERSGGGGTKGADLDALTAAAGGDAISALLAGWAAAGTTTGARLGAALLGHRGPADATATVFPSLALVEFVADVSSGSSQASAGNRPALLALSSSDYCAEISAYLSDALNGIVSSTADPPAWLKQLIDLYAPQYSGNPDLLRKTIGALALLSYATSLARPWTVSLVPDPAATAYGIEGQDPVEGGVDLTVLSGADVFADDIADCASLADAQLASVPVSGSTVAWDVSGLDGHATEATATATVDDLGTAGMSYVMTTESQDDAQNGDPVSAQMWVNAWVDRAEMAQLAAVVKSILLGDAAGSPAGSTAKALYQAMEPTLNTVMRPSGFATIDVTYHTPAASPTPTASGTAVESAGASESAGACIEAARHLAEGMPGSSETDTYPALPHNCILYLASSASTSDVETYWDQRLATLGMELLGKQSLDDGGTIWLFQRPPLGGQVTLHPDSPLRIEIAVCTQWVDKTGCQLP